jgi:uncharacterized protein YecT (DUF1311 family)
MDDPRGARPPADIFSAGCVAYFLLTGVDPYQRATPQATIRAVLAGEHRPIRELRPDLQPALAKTIEIAIRPEANARYRSAAEFSAAIRAAIRSGRASSRHYAPPPRPHQVLLRPVAPREVLPKPRTRAPKSSRSTWATKYMVWGFVGAMVMSIMAYIAARRTQSLAPDPIVQVANTPTHLPDPSDEHIRKLEARRTATLAAGPPLMAMCLIGSPRAELRLARDFGNGWSHLCSLLHGADVSGPSFGCSNGRKVVERTICSDAELREVDALLGIAYSARRAGDVEQTRQAQRQWLSRRDKTCGLPDTVGGPQTDAVPCLIRETQDRVLALLRNQ